MNMLCESYLNNMLQVLNGATQLRASCLDSTANSYFVWLHPEGVTLFSAAAVYALAISALFD